MSKRLWGQTCPKYPSGLDLTQITRLLARGWTYFAASLCSRRKLTERLKDCHGPNLIFFFFGEMAQPIEAQDLKLGKK